MDLSLSDKDLVARTILSEAAEDGLRGMVAAAWTIKNRVNSGEFGSGPRGVVLKPYAFEPWSLRRGSKNHPLNWSPESPLYKQAAYIVDNVWNDKIDDPTGGATHFFSPSAQRMFGRRNPGWSRSPELAEVGHHKFYAPEGGPVPEQDWLSEMAKGKKGAAPKAAAPTTGAEAEQDWLQKFAAQPKTPVAKEPEPANAAQAAVAAVPQMDTASAAAGGFTRGIPIIGPYVDEVAKHMAAAARSAIYKTPFKDELAAVNNYAEQTAKQHPVAEAAGEVGGGVTGLAVGGLAAPTAMGLSGSLLTRMAAGSMSGAGINAMDAAVRSGGDPSETMLGAGVGAAFGLGSPIAASAAGAGARKILGMSGTAQSYLLQRAADLGIPIRPAQTSTSGFVKKLDQMVGQLPGGGGAKDLARQNAGIERAVARTFGANDLSQGEMSAARGRIGQTFDDVQSRMRAAHDLPFQDTMDSIRDQAGFYGKEDGERVGKLIEHVTGKFGEDGSMPGETYRALTKKGTILDQATKDQNPNVRASAINLRDALDNSAIRWSDPNDSAALAQAKLAWKNMKTIEPLATKPLTPAGLRQAVNSSFKDRAYTGTGKSDLGDIAEIAEQYMREPRDSGTPIGNAIMSGLSLGPKLVGSAAGAGYGYQTGESPWGIAQDAALGLAGTAAMAKTAKTILNNPGLLSGMLARAPYAAPTTRSALTIDVNPRSGYYQQQQP